MNTLLKYVLAATAAIFLMSISLRAADADPAAQGIFKTLLTATAADDYDGFISVCDNGMKAALTKTQLEAVSNQIAPRVKDGYDADYLGELRQRGYAVHLWRLRFKSGDDVLVTLSIKDGKAGGFF